MPSNQLKFKFSETARLIKAAVAGGLTVRRVTTDANGRPLLITDQDEADDRDQKNPLDRILQNASHEDGTA
jgi:hypothetical protein